MTKNIKMDNFQPPLSLYIHLPWCVKKCPYCDFNSHPLRTEIDQPQYIDSLLSDLDYDLNIHSYPRKITSIFIGGGTPNLFSGESINRLLSEIRRRFSLDQPSRNNGNSINDNSADENWATEIEISMEVNPGTVEHTDFADYRAAGVNRLSIGVQSFHNPHLIHLGRMHNSAHAKRAILAAKTAGFTNINIDLMHALPGQTIKQALRDLEIAIDFAPSHLSLYQLTIEPNTFFHRQPPPLPGDDYVVAMQHKLRELTNQYGYENYEISAYAKNAHAKNVHTAYDYRGKHNLNYWQFGDYLGIGAGAHSKITQGGVVKRYWKQKHPRLYQNAKNAARIGGMQTLTSRELLVEFLLGGLRLTDGFDRQLITARTGQNCESVLKLLEKPINENLIEVIDSRIKCTAHGSQFLNEILLMILPD